MQMHRRYRLAAVSSGLALMMVAPTPAAGQSPTASTSCVVKPNEPTLWPRMNPVACEQARRQGQAIREQALSSASRRSADAERERLRFSREERAKLGEAKAYVDGLQRVSNAATAARDAERIAQRELASFPRQCTCVTNRREETVSTFQHRTTNTFDA